MNIEWKQEGNKVFFDYMGQEIFFIMPEDYKLSETHPDLLKMAEWLMLSPWNDVLEDHKFSRKPGKNIGLCFSAGVDSTGIHLLYPKAKMVYAERYSINDTMLKQDNALKMIDEMDEEVIRVKSNFEIVRTLHGLGLGYSTAVGMGVPLVLLADYLDLGTISYGKVLDDQYFPKGVFRDYTKAFHDRQELFKSIGLEGVYPLVGCSEVISTKLVNESKYSGLAYSCLRGELGKQCNNCFKCYRKNLLKGKEARVDRETFVLTQKNPPKMIPALLYAMKISKTPLNILNLEYLKDHDVSMLEKVYSPAYDIYSKEIKEEILNRLKSFGFEKMSPDEEEKLKQLNFCREGPKEPELPDP